VCTHRRSLTKLEPSFEAHAYIRLSAQPAAVKFLCFTPHVASSLSMLQKRQPNLKEMNAQPNKLIRYNIINIKHALLLYTCAKFQLCSYVWTSLHFNFNGINLSFSLLVLTNRAKSVEECMREKNSKILL
jgi:hypothetical protein